MGNTPKVLPLKRRVKFNYLSNSSSKNTHTFPATTTYWNNKPQQVMKATTTYWNNKLSPALGKLKKYEHARLIVRPLDAFLQISNRQVTFFNEFIFVWQLGWNKFNMKWISLQSKKQLAHPFDKACQSCSHFFWRLMGRWQMGQVGFHQRSCFYQDTEEGFRIWKDGKLLIQFPNTKPSKRSK